MPKLDPAYAKEAAPASGAPPAAAAGRGTYVKIKLNQTNFDRLARGCIEAKFCK